MAESSMRRKATISRSSFNSERFPSKDKSKLFRESFASRKVHLERNILPNAFEVLPIRSLFDSLGGDQVLHFSGPQNLSLIREFYCNIHSIHKELPASFETWVRKKSLVITGDVFRILLGLPEVRSCHFPFLTRSGVDFNCVASELCGVDRTWVTGDLLQQNELLPRFRLLNIIVCANLYVTTHSSHITQDQGYVLYCIHHRLPIDLPEMIVSKMIGVSEGRKSLGLPYGCLLTRFLTALGVRVFYDDAFAYPLKPITKLTVSQSQAHVRGSVSGVGSSGAGNDDPLAEEEEFEAANAGAPDLPELRPRSFRGQLQHFEQSVTRRLDLLTTRLDGFDGRLDEQSAMLAQILSLLQLQQPPSSPS
ncbi:hypothetical protein HYC85_028618 [Camellia sinensis]|uniref:Putative plant transposon protein domain-containing protein n=1 Tax=Camellia sinensis TaxID=4442 RepID=A0A7J7FWE0_CAMSI|nr:hypothetical protein HYC85_028618 [Camellia sinensis]